MAAPANNNQPIRINNPDGSEVSPKILTVSTIENTENVTYTAAQVLGGLIRRNPNGGSRCDTFPSAVDLITGLGTSNYVPVGTSVRLLIRNLASGVDKVNLQTGTGVTFEGENSIPGDSDKEMLVVVTGATTVTVYLLGSVNYTV